MDKRKRVTLTFEIDDHEGFNDEAFMRTDFLQELNCCVNMPYADTFIMKVEDAAAPQEHELYKEYERMCNTYHKSNDCRGCPLHFYETCDVVDIARVVKEWAEEHPDRLERKQNDG